jgi:hypothetical protein
MNGAGPVGSITELSAWRCIASKIMANTLTFVGPHHPPRPGRKLGRACEIDHCGPFTPQAHW